MTEHDEKSPAAELDDESGYFPDIRGWALARGEPGDILSTTHGFVLCHPPRDSRQTITAGYHGLRLQVSLRKCMAKPTQ